MPWVRGHYARAPRSGGRRAETRAAVIALIVLFAVIVLVLLLR